MKDVQQLGGAYEVESVRVGLPRQITVDTDNWRLRLHDGIEVGGYQFYSHNENIQFFQPASSELWGISQSFEPYDRGFVSRVDPGAYIVRSIVGTNGETVVVNGSGVEGNPRIELDDVITKDLLFTGEVQFDSTIQVEGLVGDTQGDHTGDVQGNVTGDLTGDSTGTHTGPSVGSIDTRGAEVHFDDGQIPFSAIGGIPPAAVGIPVGFIGLWSGDSEDIPDGWVLCDGANGTPDLRNRFVVCAGDDYDSHGTGGSNSYTPAGTLESNGDHAHAGTAADHTLTIEQIPSHRHASGVCDSNTNFFNRGSIAANPLPPSSIDAKSPSGTQEALGQLVGGGQPHGHTVEIEEAGNHTHAFTGAGATIMPPYYALCYIMKV